MLLNVCYFAFMIWGISEVILGIFKKSPQDALIKDTNSHWQNWIIWPSVSLGVFSASWLKQNGFHIADFKVTAEISEITGLMLLALGVLIRWNAILVLGKYFSTNLTVQENQKIIISGPYRYIRHPGYTGVIICFSAFSIAMSNWLSLIFIGVIPSWTFLKRIDFEESMLLKRFGSTYEDYRTRTKKLIPWMY